MADGNFRCPECWRSYSNAATVENHRRRSQGACANGRGVKTRAIAAYRKRHGIEKTLPLPKPGDQSNG